MPAPVGEAAAGRPSEGPVCNLCGAAAWVDMNNRRGVRCARCGSLERTRSIKLILDAMGRPKPGSQILHLAPEIGIASWLKNLSPNGYDPVDLDPSRYPSVGVRKFDLVADGPQAARQPL